MKILSLAMVGCGESGSDFALVSRFIPYAQFTAACDMNPDRLEKFARRNRISTVYTNYEDVLAREDIDAVVLATPHDLHYAMILSAVDAGKHVLVEKPVTRTLQEALDLLPRIRGAKVGVNFQFRYDKGCYAMARAVQAGELGKIHSVRINVPWHRERSYFESSSWHKTVARAGGGTLITQASHFLDVVLWALGEKPASAYGVTKTIGFDVDVDTLTHAIGETENETLISITTRMLISSEQSAQIEVYGERGTAVYTMKPSPGVIFKDVKVKKQKPPGWGFHSYQRSLAGFARWILEDEPYLIPVEESISVLAVIDAIYRSAASGKRELIQ